MAAPRLKKPPTDAGRVRKLPALKVVPRKAPPGGEVAGSNNLDALLALVTQGSPIATLTTMGGTRILLNPDPIVRLYSKGMGMGVYDDVQNKDAHIAGLIDTRIMAVAGLPREIQPGDPNDAQAQAVAETVREAFDRWTSFDEDVRAGMQALMGGWRPAELEWQVWDDGLVGPKKLHDRDPNGFLFDVDWQLRMRTINHVIEGEPLPPRKFIVWQYRPTANNPYGTGLGRSLWWAWWAKANGLRSWLVALEKFGVPTLLLKHQPGLSKGKRDAMVEKASKIQTDTVLAMSNDIDHFLLTNPGGTSSHKEFCGYVDDSCSVRVLGQALTQTAKNTGLNSRQSTEAGKVRQDLLEGDARWIGNLLTGTVVRWIVDFNYGPIADNLYPRVIFSAAPPVDLQAEAEKDKTVVADMGLPVPTRYFYEKYGYPTPEPGEELINDKIAAAAQAALPPGLNPRDMLSGAQGGDQPPGKGFAEDDVREFYNMRHQPKGSPKGGEFAPAPEVAGSPLMTPKELLTSLHRHDADATAKHIARLIGKKGWPQTGREAAELMRETLSAAYNGIEIALNAHSGNWELSATDPSGNPVVWQFRSPGLPRITGRRAK